MTAARGTETDKSPIPWTFTDLLAKIARRIALRPTMRKCSTLMRIACPLRSGWTTISDYDGNLKMRLNRAAYIGSCIYWYGAHSRGITSYLRSFLRPNMVVADVGANQGEITLFCAKRVARVLAFEPCPDLFAQLQDNVKLNNFGNVSLFDFALHQSSGSAQMFRLEDRSDRLRAMNEGVSTLFTRSFTDSSIVAVHLRTFDSVVDELGLSSLDLIKIDVEGAELMVLYGAEQTIRRFRPTLIIEVSHSNYAAAGYTVDDVREFLSKHDYNMLPLDPSFVGNEYDVVCAPK